jgi:hypothetical protein
LYVIHAFLFIFIINGLHLCIILFLNMKSNRIKIGIYAAASSKVQSILCTMVVCEHWFTSLFCAAQQEGNVLL